MIYRFFYKLYICTCIIYDIIWIFILVYLVLNAEMKYENAIEMNFNREIFVSPTIYIYRKFIALMKAQMWWKGSKTFRIRNERSWFYYFVIFLYQKKKKKKFHYNFASQPFFNSSFSFRQNYAQFQKNSFQTKRNKFNLAFSLSNDFAS